MAVAPGTVQHGVPARVLGANLCAVLDQQTHDLRIAIASCVVDRLIAATIGRCGQIRMPAKERAYPRGIREKHRRQELSRQIIYRPDMCF